LELGKDIDSDPLIRAFSFTREKEKAMCGLKGILAGIVADKHLNEKEFLFLDAWLKSQQFLSEDKDVVDILGRVGDILEDGQISEDDLQQMLVRMEQLISAKDDVTTDVVGRVDELIGFLTGIASDGVLNDEEVNALSDWLDQNETIKETWPAIIIVNRLSNILEDGIVSDEERDDLLLTINQVTGANIEEDGITLEASTEVWEDSIESLTVAGSTFCLTGDFVSGDRNSVDTMLRCMGADTSSSINKNVDYLVIGTLASRDWLYTSHGRKIEKALLLKREGNDITIMTERTLLKFTR